MHLPSQPNQFAPFCYFDIHKTPSTMSSSSESDTSFACQGQDTSPPPSPPQTPLRSASANLKVESPSPTRSTSIVVSKLENVASQHQVTRKGSVVRHKDVPRASVGRSKPPQTLLKYLSPWAQLRYRGQKKEPASAVKSSSILRETAVEMAVLIGARKRLGSRLNHPGAGRH